MIDFAGRQHFELAVRTLLEVMAVVHCEHPSDTRQDSDYLLKELGASQVQCIWHVVAVAVAPTQAQMVYLASEMETPRIGYSPLTMLEILQPVRSTNRHLSFQARAFRQTIEFVHSEVGFGTPLGSVGVEHVQFRRVTESCPLSQNETEGCCLMSSVASLEEIVVVPHILN